MTVWRIKAGQIFSDSVRLKIKTGCNKFVKDNFPNQNDNIKQICLKLLYLFLIIGIVANSLHVLTYFGSVAHQNRMREESLEIWENAKIKQDEKFRILKEQNEDFKGWLKVGGTNINTPVYQSEDDSFYKNHNQHKKKDEHGALYMASYNTPDSFITDKHIVISGCNAKDGTVFGTLSRYKNLQFYKENPNISLTTASGGRRYRVFAVLTLNTDIKDDNNYVFNAFKRDFIDENDFHIWLGELKQRSLIDSKTDVFSTDNFLSLVTESNEFDGAVTVVMARQYRENEYSGNQSDLSVINKNIRYPKRWYDERNLKYPY